MRCYCPAVPREQNPSARTSSSAPDSDAHPGVREPAWVRAPAWGAEPEAVAPEVAVPEVAVLEVAVLGAYSADCSCSCGGAGGADAPATAPGHWPEPAPVQTEAASILSSCLYFLAPCSLVHRFPFSAVFCRTVSTVCLPLARMLQIKQRDGGQTSGFQDSEEIAPDSGSADNSLRHHEAMPHLRRRFAKAPTDHRACRRDRYGAASSFLR